MCFRSMLEDKIHPAIKHYHKGYDFSEVIAPARTLMVATTPRSGSTFFSLEMWKTGVLGAPLEYLNFELLVKVGRWQHCVIDPKQYWQDVQRVRTAGSGLFSFKMFPTNYSAIAALDPALLNLVAPDFVVFFRRRDRISQAISYSRAIQSGAWFDGMKGKRSRFDKAHIDWCIESLDAQEEFWLRSFELTKASFIEVFYEDLLESPRLVLGRVARHCLLSLPAENMLSIESVRRQRDRTSKRWRKIFMEGSSSLSANGC